MPNFRTIIEITLDDVNEGSFEIDIDKFTGKKLRIDLLTVKESMDSMANQIEGVQTYHRPKRREARGVDLPSTRITSDN